MYEYSRVLVVVVPTGETAEHNNITEIKEHFNGTLVLSRDGSIVAAYPIGTWISGHIHHGSEPLSVAIR